MSKGKFIVIEGIDGSGKSTQIRLIKEAMDYRGITSHLTREASDGPIGKLLRNTYLAGVRKVDRRIINMLYPADRFDHITNEEDGMLHKVNMGVHVLCDRYYMSSMAYHAAEFYETPTYQASLQYILNLNKPNRELMIPDLTIYLQVDPDIAFSRISEVRVPSEISVYENPEYLSTVSKAYEDAIRLLRSNGERVICIDGNRDTKDISDNIMDILSTIIPELE